MNVYEFRQRLDTFYHLQEDAVQRNMPLAAGHWKEQINKLKEEYYGQFTYSLTPKGQAFQQMRRNHHE
jgi:hypothetical protein